jgi:hypothetical protein
LLRPPPFEPPLRDTARWPADGCSGARSRARLRPLSLLPDEPIELEPDDEEDPADEPPEELDPPPPPRSVPDPELEPVVFGREPACPAHAGVRLSANAAATTPTVSL